ncbi:MAG: phosphoglycerate kinase [Kiritimatiellae bacterium]|nr:phosphoglycerate kinase [Kiritimatiellia bacterium]MBR4612444.1 phosphoglycerate kinase [Kiritimatiellia bacterium]
MSKKTIRDIDLAGKRVVMRADFNVPMAKDGSGKITDDTRIQAALPSIKYILDKGASLVLMSHLGRPKGKGFEPEFTLKPVADRLAELIGREVKFAPDCMAADEIAAALKPGEVVLLENTRFYKAEDGKVKKDDDKKGIHLTEEEYQEKKAALKAARKDMAKKLASYGNVYVNDAFGTAHRAHASTAVIADYLKPAVSGFLMEKELKFLGDAVDNPVRPFVAILGGAKVSDKLAVVKNLLQKVDTLIIGGGMAYTFKKALGIKIGTSLCEDEQVAYCKEMLDAAKAKGVKILLPVDNVIADKFPETKDASDIKIELCEGDIPDGWMGLDIGPKSVALFSEAIKGAKTVVWNGPMGCFEFAPLAKGTFGVCDAVATVKPNGGTSIIGGGDSVSAVKKSGKAADMTHISTGGGASLEFLEGKELPGVAALEDA